MSKSMAEQVLGSGMDNQTQPSAGNADKAVVKLTHAVIELRLRLHILNLCMACAGEREGDIRIAKNILVDEVVKLVGEVRAGGVGS